MTSLSCVLGGGWFSCVLVHQHPGLSLCPPPARPSAAAAPPLLLPAPRAAAQPHAHLARPGSALAPLRAGEDVPGPWLRDAKAEAKQRGLGYRHTQAADNLLTSVNTTDRVIGHLYKTVEGERNCVNTAVREATFKGDGLTQI